MKFSFIPVALLVAALAHAVGVAKDVPDQPAPGAKKLIEEAGGAVKNAKGQWELKHHWIGEMKHLIGEKPNEYANLVGRIRFDLIGSISNRPDMPALEQSYRDDLSEVILYHEGLPAIEDLQDRAKANAILVRMWPLQLQDIQDDDGKTDYTREWNLFEHASNNQLRVLHIEASITRNEYKKKDILFHGFVAVSYTHLTLPTKRIV